MKKAIEKVEKQDSKKKYHNSIWAFKIDQTHSWAFANDVFTPTECRKIIALGENLNLETALTGSNRIGNKEIRDSKTSWIFPQEDTEWIYYRLTQVVLQLNSEYFNFDLFGFIEGFQFTKYEAPSGHYDCHIDKMFGKTIRKLSIVLQLSDPDDYEGGDLEITFGKNPDVMEKAIGKVIVFPSYALHKVTPITKGIRYSLVAWVTGEPFK